MRMWDTSSHRCSSLASQAGAARMGFSTTNKTVKVDRTKAACGLGPLMKNSPDSWRDQTKMMLPVNLRPWTQPTQLATKKTHQYIYLQAAEEIFSLRKRNSQHFHFTKSCMQRSRDWRSKNSYLLLSLVRDLPVSAVAAPAAKDTSSYKTVKLFSSSLIGSLAG